MRFLTGAIFVCLYFIAFQPSASSQSVLTGVQNVVPPSPEVSALFRNLNYGVDHASGVGQINIPLFEVKSGSLSVPVSLSYNGAGRRVFDVTGPVGIGWSLNAGGAISRTVYGRPDDQSTFPFELKHADDLNNATDYDYLSRLYYKEHQGDNDCEYDLFSYFFGGSSGKFVVDHPQNGDLTFHTLPYQALKFGSGRGGASYSGAYPSLFTDEKGITYHFEATEQTGDGYNPVITTRLLTRMVSADKKDEITFTYTSVPQKRWMKLQEVVIIDDRYMDGTSGGGFNQSNNFPGDYTEYAVQRLTQITFREGKLKFLLNPSTDRVKSIQLFNNHNELIRSVELQSSVLDYPMFGTTTTGIYKLDNLVFQDKLSKDVEKYAFEYNRSSGFSTHDRDYWGYCNGAGNSTPVPPNPLINVFIVYNGLTVFPSTTFIRGGDRTARPRVDGMLKKVIYPTGAATEFSYEGNRFKWANDLYMGGGLRVSQTKTIDANGASNIKTYEYGEDGFGTVSLGAFYPEHTGYEKRYFTNITGASPTPSTYRKRVYTSEFMSSIADAANDPVFYSKVTEYNGTRENNRGKTEYAYNGSYPYSIEGMGSPAYGTPTLPYAGISFTTCQPDYDLTQKHIYRYTLWTKNRLTTTSVYSNNGDNSYMLLKSVYNDYKYTQTGSLRGFHIIKYIECGYNDITSSSSAGSGAERTGAEEFGFPIFRFRDYEVTTGKEELIATYETDNTRNGSVTKETKYTYNDKLLPVSITTKSSDGAEQRTDIKYPEDFTGDPALGPVSRLMVDANMISYPVEQTLFKGAVPLTSTKNIYANWGSISAPQILPQFIQVKRNNGPYENRVVFGEYDERGNVTTVSKVNDLEKVYIWGYDKTYPVAEVTGASYKAVMSVLNEVTLNHPADDAALRTELDKIRAAFPAARVATYTYKPLVGVTSQTDLNGRTVYYQYDAFGRLSIVRDKDHNILKQFCYNYMGGAENCFLPSIYVRLEHTQDYAYSDPYYSYEGTVYYIRFYADATCSTPLTLPQAVGINYNYHTAQQSYYGYYDDNVSGIMIGEAGTTEYWIGYTDLSTCYYDGYYNFCTTQTLTLLPGANYVIVN